MEQDAKVKYRGIQIGKVKDIEYAGDQAKLTLAIDSEPAALHPVERRRAHRAAHTVFGAKSVEFLPPDAAVGQLAAPRRTVQAAAVQLEVNTLFQTLTDVLHKVDPVNLNATLIGAGRGPARQRRRPRRHPGGPESLSAATQSEVADAAERSAADRHGRQHLRRRRARPGDGVRQRADDQQHDRRPAGQPERDAAGGHRAGQQRLRHPGTRRPTTTSPRSSGCARR